MRNVIGITAMCVSLNSFAQSPSYRVHQTSAEAEVLMTGGEAWKDAAVINWGPQTYTTTFRALYSDGGLWVRFDATDPSPWHTMTRRDDRIWEEEVVEIFIDLDRSGTNYAEVELSPFNVVCDVRMVRASPDKEMDLAWNLEGLSSRVRPLHDGAGDVVGWTALAFLPWSGFRSLPSARGVRLPPGDGDRFRFNVFRIERPGGREQPEKDVVYAAWSKPPGPSFHAPSVFRDLIFVSAK